MKKLFNLLACMFAMGLVGFLSGCGDTKKSPEDNSQTPSSIVDQSVQPSDNPQESNSEQHVHSWDSGKVTLEPTCTEKGTKTFTCSCGETKTEEIGALGHDVVHHDAKDPTCTEIGWDAYDTCTRCDYTTYVEKAALGHNPAEAVIENNVDPTCITAGSYDEVVYCSVCHDELSRVHKDVQALDHDLVHHDAKDPNCTEIGWDAYDTCTRCDYTTYVEKAALGHKPAEAVIENNVDPTCTSAGSYDEVVYCSVCNDELSRVHKDVQALDHDLVHHDAKNPNCTEIGWDAYDTCTRCDYTTYVEKAALGHKPADAVIENNVDPTCLAAGSYDEVVYCSVCNDELSRTHKDVSATGHDYSLSKQDYSNVPNGKIDIYKVCSHDETHVEYDKSIFLETYEIVEHATAVAHGSNEAFSADLSSMRWQIKKMGTGANQWTRFNFTAYNNGSFKYAYVVVKGGIAELNLGAKVDGDGNPYDGKSGNKQYKGIGTDTVMFIWDLEKIGIDSKKINKVVFWPYSKSADVTSGTFEVLGGGLFNTIEGNEPVELHQFASAWSSDENNHYHLCDCGEKHDEAAHVEETIPAVEATYDAQGSTAGVKCSVCGRILVEPQSVPKLQYVLTINANGGKVLFNGQEITSLPVDKGTPATTLNSLGVIAPEHYAFEKWQMLYNDAYVDIPANATVTSDLTIRPLFVLDEAIYKVVIEAEHYTKTSSGATFTFPETKQYRNATAEFAKDLGLSYNEAEDYYYAYGKLGETPNFATALELLPDVYKLVGELPTDVVEEDPVTYNFKFCIDEEAIGYPLSKIHVSWAYDTTTYEIGLYKDATNAGLMVKVPGGLVKAYSTPLQITFDDLDVSLYDEIKISGAMKFDTTARNTKWYVSGEAININDASVIMQWGALTYSNFNIDVLAKMNEKGQKTLKQVDVRPAVAEADNAFTLYIRNISLKEKEDNRHIKFRVDDDDYATLTIANGSKVTAPETEPTKDGYNFTCWVKEGEETAFDFDSVVKSDLVLVAKFEEIAQAMYKVVIETEYYTKTSSGATFSFPETKQYHDATSEFAKDLGLSYNEAEDYYYAMGEVGTTPSFSALSSLPSVYKLVGSMPETTIAEETVTYNIKYCIDETALGYPLSKLHVSWAYDNTTYEIGLFKDEEKAGFMVKVPDGLAKAYSAPLQIVFDDLGVSLYDEIKISGALKFDTTARNTKWYVSGETYNINDASVIMQWGALTYSNFNIDVLAKMNEKGQNILKQVDVRPAVAETGNGFTLYIDHITLKESAE